MRALALRSADDFVYSRSEIQQRRHDSITKTPSMPDGIPQDAGASSKGTSGQESAIDQNGKNLEEGEEGEEGEWNEEEKKSTPSVIESSDKTSVSNRRAIRLGEGILLLPRIRDRPSRAPPPNLYYDCSSIVYASFNVYSTPTSLVVQLLPNRKSLSPIQPSLDGLEAGTPLILAPFEQEATFVCFLAFLDLGLGSRSIPGLEEDHSGSDSGSTSSLREGQISTPSNSTPSPLRQLADSMRLELEQAGIFEQSEFLEEEEWIVCRVGNFESSLSSEENAAETSTSTVFPAVQEASFLWPSRLAFWNLDAPLPQLDLKSGSRDSEALEMSSSSPSQVSTPLQYLSLAEIASKTSQLLKNLAANGARIMASAASPMPSPVTGAGTSTTRPSPAASTSAFTPGFYNGAPTPAGSQLSSMTPAPFSINTPGNHLQHSEMQQDQENARAEPREAEEEDEDGGDLDLWGGEGDDGSAEDEPNGTENEKGVGNQEKEGQKNTSAIDSSLPPITSTDRVKDDMSLNGQDEEMNGSVIGSIIDGNDFDGLVTEDDFSFFDDGAFAFAPMDVDSNPNANGSRMDSLSTFEDHTGPTLNRSNQPHPSEVSSSIPIDTQGNHPLSTSASASSGVDPPSLPGFTPSSLTASSPAFANGNGMNAKTPRTPFSPYNEFNEPAIVGENDMSTVGNGMGGYRDSRNETQESFESSTNGDTSGHGRAESSDNVTPKLGESDGELPSTKSGYGGRTVNGVRDLGNKYEFGKFAVPDQNSNGVASVEINVNGSDRKRSASSNGLSRKRGRRTVFGISSNSYDGQDADSLQPWQLQSTSNGRSRFNSNSHSLKSVFKPYSTPMPPIHKLRLTENGVVPGSGILSANGGWSLGGLDEIASDLETMDDSGSETSSFREGDSSDGDSEDGSDDGKQEVKAQLFENSKSMLRLMATWSIVVECSTNSPSTPPTPSPKRKDEELKDIVDVTLRGSFCKLKDYSDQKTLDAAPVVSASQLEDLLGSFASSSSTFANSSTAHTSNSKGIEVLEPSKVLVGCQGAIVKFEPSVLRFWDKLALTPSSGQKPVIAFLLQSVDAIPGQIIGWFSRVQQAYQVSPRQTGSDVIGAMVAEFHSPFCFLPFSSSVWDPITLKLSSIWQARTILLRGISLRC